MTAQAAPAEAATKRCTRCGETKLLDQFQHNTTKRDGRQSHCKSCGTLIMRAWRAANPERAQNLNRRSNLKWRVENPEGPRRKHLWREHRMTPSGYEAMLANQGGVCANPACGRTPNGKAFHVDHDHDHDWAHRANQTSCPQCWRGLLCGQCNQAIGLASDNPARLRGLADYIEARQRPELARGGELPAEVTGGA